MNYPEGQGFRYGGGQVTGRVTTLVRVRSDRGAVGWGASYAYPDIVRIIIEKHLAPHLTGADAGDVEGLWDKMYSLTRWYGRKGAAISALGAVDIALWDIRGKVEGAPVYQLLGGGSGEVTAYASGLLWQDEMSLLEDEAKRHLKDGFRLMKMRLGRDAGYDRNAVTVLAPLLAGRARLAVDGTHRYS